MKVQVKIHDCVLDCEVPDEHVINALVAALYPQIKIEPVEDLEEVHLLIAQNYLKSLVEAVHE